MNWYFDVLKKYAVFRGRARRREYWYFTLVNLVIAVVLAILGTRTGFRSLSTVYSLLVFLPSLGVAVRRMHDVNKSGWFCIIPIYNLILACTNGTAGPNRYGEDPKAGAAFGAEDYERPVDASIN